MNYNYFLNKNMPKATKAVKKTTPKKASKTVKNKPTSKRTKVKLRGG